LPTYFIRPKAKRVVKFYKLTKAGSTMLVRNRSRLKIEPTSKVKAEYDGTDLRTITKIDEHDCGVQSPPP